MRFMYCVFLPLVISTVLLDLGAAQKACTKPRKVAGATFNCNHYNHGGKCTYTCDEQYIQQGGGNELTCDKGVWKWPAAGKIACETGKRCTASPKRPPCTRCPTGCNQPYVHNEKCTYECQSWCTNEGGNKVFTCNDGNWINPNPLQCKRRCLKGPQIPFCAKQIGCSEEGPIFHHGAVCDFTCREPECTKTGGANSLTCDDGNWVGDPLVCERN